MCLKIYAATWIAQVWNRTLVEDHVQAKLFFDKIVMTEDNSRSYECRAMSELSQIAASRLLDIFMGKGRKKEQSVFNCFQKQRRNERLSKCLRWLVWVKSKLAKTAQTKTAINIFSRYQSKAFVVVPDHASKLFELVLGKFDDQLKTVVDEFIKLPMMNIELELSNVLQQERLDEVFIVNAPNSPVNYHYCQETRRLFVNCRDQRLVQADGKVVDREGFFNILIFKFLPEIFEGDDSFNGKFFKPFCLFNVFLGMSIVNKLIRLSETTVPEARAEARAEALAVDVRSHLTDSELDSSFVPDSPRRPLKKQKPDSDEPPAGYKFYDGPRLLMKL